MMSSLLRTSALLAAGALLLPFTAGAMPYQVDHSQSSVGFRGTHAGAPFKGQFQTWQADIVFDDANLAASKLKATFTTASAKTGNASYDGTLPTADWFDSANHPTAVFESQRITRGEKADTFLAEGTLTIRGTSQPLTLPFTLTPAATDGSRTATATLKLDRLAYAIGAKSDGAAAWVGREITIDLNVVARPSNQTN